MKVTIITDALEKKGYLKGKSYLLTPHLAGLFIGREWAELYQERKRKARVLYSQDSTDGGAGELGVSQGPSEAR